MELVLLRYGELWLKGHNRPFFLRRLRHNVRDCLKQHGVTGQIREEDSRLIVYTAEASAILPHLARIFGVTSVSAGIAVPKDLERIRAEVRRIALSQLGPEVSFRIRARRADKRFPLTSPQLEHELGAEVQDLTAAPVDLSDRAASAVYTMVQTTVDQRTVLVRSKPLDSATKVLIQDELREKFGPLTELRYEFVGPTVGREVTRSAALAVLAAAGAIIMYLIFAFRSVPNAIRYGICAVAAMIHDILVAVGVFSILGLALGWEVDALFLTAILTVIGFSVQDTIVVFDRIRENIPKCRGEPFELVVNRSLLETLHRSLATQLKRLPSPSFSSAGRR